MVTNSLIEPKDVDAERGVILEEIAMNDDDPSDTVHEAFAAQLFGDTPLGRPILGTAESISSTVDSASRLAYLTFSNPVIKALAFASGTSRAVRRFRRDQGPE